MDWKKLFPGFEAGLLELIERESTLKTFQARDVIMRRGQYIKSTLLVLKGRIKIYREHEDGGEFLVYYLQPGEACAISLTCLQHSEASEVTAIAEEDTEVLLIPAELMEMLMGNYKICYEFVIKTYRARFDELLSVIDNIAFRNMDERLESYLKRHIEVTGRKQIDLSHQQIAQDLNSSREVISRLLKKMEQRKLVQLHRTMIEWL